MKSVVLAVVLVGCSGSSPGVPDGPSTDGRPAGDGPNGDGPVGAMCPAAVAAPGCNGTTGLAGPLMTCSAAMPCTSGTQSVVTEIDAPTCTPSGGGAADPIMQWTDDNGDARYACIGAPTPATTGPHPLVLWFHGAESSADALYDSTDLRAAADASGFTIVAVQGRNVHWFGPDPDTQTSGRRYDLLYRDLGPASCNPDVRSIDHLIDQLVAGGTIDATKIFAIGWSNGAFFAQMYGIARHTTPTPGGNHIAAVAAYAGADPFTDLIGQGSPSCELSPYPTSAVPVYALHRSCDAIIPCDLAAESSPQLGGDVESWLEALRTKVGDPNAVDVIINGTGAQVEVCDASCGAVVGTANHINWPNTWESRMLGFLFAHPL